MVNAVIDRSFFLVMPDSIGHVPVFVRLLFFFLRIFISCSSLTGQVAQIMALLSMYKPLCMYQKQIQKNKIRLKA
jgi:hypothetical protein